MTGQSYSAINYPPLLKHILDGKEYGSILNSKNFTKHQLAWRNLFRELLNCPPENLEMAKTFHTNWHISHHYIRELIGNDDLLIDVLWVWLPPYKDRSPITLYRGENIHRFDNNKIGTAWSSREEIARMFGRGLNAIHSGGTLLKTTAPASSIIAAPSKHSVYLGEYEFTLDTRKLGEIIRVENFCQLTFSA
ncbi:hypothetical protein HQN60_08905 [Deefgea piscis]|uniref:Uncharacterized protein n=1 Tax=Deefgea piscis TaxID=2739061 RepID=A0A6M8SPY6_9NEIS|nr:hypothetical protein [Deefgea piscis]QKJ66811.1 hypothetical protein HQN60_08905 [Deefgea piscis]